MSSAYLLMFVVGASAALYITFGYPVLLSCLARYRGSPVHRKLELKTVSVIVAVHNGEWWIHQKLRSVLGLRYPRDLMQILIVSDGSTDRTDEYVSEFASDGIELLRIERAGKAMAVNAALERARGEVLFFTDIRQPLDPDCLSSLVATLGDPIVGAAAGHVLFRDKDAQKAAHMGMYWRYEKWVRRNLSRLDSMLAGSCVYAMRRDLAKPMPPGLLLDDSYLPLGAFFKGYRFVLDDNAVVYEYPTPLRVEFRRKVRTLAGIYQIAMVLPEILTAANRMRFHFVSYQLGRVILPFALLLAAAGSVGLPGLWGSMALAIQAGLYCTALIDPFVPVRSSLKRFTSFICAVFVLMAASLCAVAIFFRPAQSFWKETTLQKGIQSEESQR